MNDNDKTYFLLMKEELDIMNETKKKALEVLETYTAVYKAIVDCEQRNMADGYNGDYWYVYARGSRWHTNELGDITSGSSDDYLKVTGDIADIALKFTRLIMADGCTAGQVYIAR